MTTLSRERVTHWSFGLSCLMVSLTPRHPCPSRQHWQTVKYKTNTYRDRYREKVKKNTLHTTEILEQRRNKYQSMSRQKQDRATSRLNHAKISVRSLFKKEKKYRRGKEKYTYLNGVRPALKRGGGDSTQRYACTMLYALLVYIQKFVWSSNDAASRRVSFVYSPLKRLPLHVIVTHELDDLLLSFATIPANKKIHFIYTRLHVISFR